MSDERSEMIKSLKEIFILELRNINFKGSYPHFRRTIGDKTNLLTFQFDRNGGGFIIELANFTGTEFKTPWGAVILPNKLTAHDINERKRIYPNSLKEDNGKDSWFRYDKKSILFFGSKFDKLSKQALQRLPLIEEYWNS